MIHEEVIQFITEHIVQVWHTTNSHHISRIFLLSEAGHQVCLDSWDQDA
jgi:hypothetical protein